MKIRQFGMIFASLFILLAVVVSFNIFLKRLDYDASRHVAQYGLSSDDLITLQEMSGNDLQTMLAVLKDQVGVSTILVPEYTIESYERLSKITVLEGYQIINTLRVGQLYRTVLSRLRQKTSIEPRATYIVVDEVAIYRRIIGHLKLYLPRDSVIEHSGQIIQVNLTKDRLMSLPLGFNSDLIDSFVSYGFNVVPELKSYDIFSKEKLVLMFSELEKNPQVSAIKFHKKFKFSESRHLNEYIQLMQRANLKLVLPEFSQYYYDEPDPLNFIAAQLGSKVIVSHGIDDDDFDFTFKQLFERYTRALNERSPQLILFPVNQSQAISDLYDKNILFMKKVIDTFERSGGKTLTFFTTFPAISVSFYEKGAIGLGIFSVLYLLILKVHRITTIRQIGFLLLAMFFVYVLILAIPSMTSPFFGIIAAVVAPVFGMVYFFPDSKTLFFKYKWSRFWYLSKYFAQILACCLLAVLFLIALYSDPVYLNNIRPFWGVKLSLLLPVLLIGFFYFCGPLRVNSFFYVIRRVLRYPITYYGLLILLGSFLVILMYLFRSGNYFQLLGFEASIRSFLQDVFIIRPRFKEFIIGYPALFFGFWLVSKNQGKDILWLLNGMGAIALTSVINSFCHFHTPVLISLYRTMWGFLLGMVVILCLIYMGKLINFMFRSIKLIRGS
ncbi:MAG: DUF5693 family protein [Candidatus Margulisiibacteriota bacterium]